MVVRLDLERDCEPITDRDDAGVLAGPLQHVWCLCRESLQNGTRMLVGAVLTPESADDPQLGERGRAPEHGDQTLVLLLVDPMFRDERRGDSGITSAWRHRGHTRLPLSRESTPGVSLRPRIQAQDCTLAPGAASSQARCRRR